MLTDGDKIVAEIDGGSALIYNQDILIFTPINKSLIHVNQRIDYDLKVIFDLNV